MKIIYSLLHFQHKTPKRLILSLPAQEPAADKLEGIVLSIESEGNSQAFTLSTAEISEVNAALSYACDVLQMRRIAALNAKYGNVKKDRIENVRHSPDKKEVIRNDRK